VAAVEHDEARAVLGQRAKHRAKHLVRVRLRVRARVRVRAGVRARVSTAPNTSLVMTPRSATSMGTMATPLSSAAASPPSTAAWFAPMPQ